MSDITFGLVTEDKRFAVTSFYFNIDTYSFYITIEYGMYVEQLVLSSHEVERIGLIDLSKLKPFTDTIKRNAKN